MLITRVLDAKAINDATAICLPNFQTLGESHGSHDSTVGQNLSYTGLKLRMHRNSLLIVFPETCNAVLTVKNAYTPLYKQYVDKTCMCMVCGS